MPRGVYCWVRFIFRNVYSKSIKMEIPENTIRLHFASLFSWGVLKLLIVLGRLSAKSATVHTATSGAYKEFGWDLVLTPATIPFATYTCATSDTSKTFLGWLLY